MFKKIAVIAALLCTLIGMSGDSFAEDGPAAQVKNTIEQVRDVVGKEDGKTAPAVLDEKLKGIVFPMFDFAEMSRRSLGANWNKATPDQQKEFVSLFSDLLAVTYLKRIKSNAASSEIKEISDTIEGEKAMVKSVLIADGESISIDYRLLNEQGKWRIYDVLIEHVGLVSNYRNEFAELVRKDGFPGLIQRLKDKKAKRES